MCIIATTSQRHNIYRYDSLASFKTFLYIITLQWRLEGGRTSFVARHSRRTTTVSPRRILNIIVERAFCNIIVYGISSLLYNAKNKMCMYSNCGNTADESYGIVFRGFCDKRMPKIIALSFSMTIMYNNMISYC